MSKREIIGKTRRAFRTVVLATGKRVPFVHAAARTTVAAMRKRAYDRLCRENPVDDTVAIFESFSGRNYSCSPRGLYVRMLEDPRFSQHTLVWAFKSPIAQALAERGYDVRGLDSVYVHQPYDGDLDQLFGERALEELRRAVIVAWGSGEYYRMYARASLWVSNARIPAHLFPREGQTFVQTWHGTPLKRLGFDIPQSASSNAIYSFNDLRRQYALEGARFTHLLSPSPFTTEKLSSAFNLIETGRTDTVLELGYPRNDFLATVTGDEVARIRRRLDLPEGKRVVLYAPTWRDDQHSSSTGYTLEMQADFDGLKRDLGEDHVILFRAHYLIANDFDFGRYDGFIRDVSGVSDINDLYVVSDLLVTDYSSVFFDFANLERGIVFYMYDLERYAEDIRGFYLDLDELPGPVVKTETELVAAIRRTAAPDAAAAERLSRFKERFCPLDDGHASERVLDRVVPAGVGAGVRS